MLKSWIRKALTKKVLAEEGRSRKLRIKETTPSEKLVLLVEFSIVAIAGLSIIEIVHIVNLGSWNSEVFVAISGLIGTVTGIVIRSKA
ncbi:MAG: hypothetical protein ACETV1_03995 [Candidatus Bathyarchaeia archaeon]